MKYILTIVLFINIACSSANSDPDWWYKIEEKKDQIIGYGQGNTLNGARKQAKTSIAFSISTKITSERTTLKNTSNQNTTKKTFSYSNQSTKEKLNNLESIKVTDINNMWFIAVLYDWTDLAVKFKNRLEGYPLKNQKQNSYLAHTSIVKNLNAVIGKKLNYKLYRKKNVWNIAYDDVSFNLDRDEFSKLFTSKTSKIISCELKDEEYNSGDKLSLNIKSSKEGYVSVFYVGSDGQVGVLGKNLKINKNLSFPNDERLILKNNDDIDKRFMISVLYSKKKISLEGFDRVTINEIKNDNFTKLLQYFEKYEYTTESARITSN